MRYTAKVVKPSKATEQEVKNSMVEYFCNGNRDILETLNLINISIVTLLMDEALGYIKGNVNNKRIYNIITTFSIHFPCAHPGMKLPEASALTTS